MRVKNLMRNSFFSVFSQIVLIGFGFVSNRVLNLRLGEALVGLNGVVSNIISILSVSELGIATAVVYHLYQALAKQDEREIAGLMNLYRRAYRIFAVAITALGLAVLPFLQLFLKDNPFTTDYVRIIYLLWLLRTVLSYLLSYRRSLLIADQQEYIVSITALFANAVNYSVVIGIVSVTENYVLALSINIVVEAVSNLWISYYVNRRYPFLKTFRRQAVEDGVKKSVFGNIKNIFVVRLANKLLTATDNVIVSGFIGVAFAGLYSNYCLIVNALINIAVALSNSLQPGVGTMFAAKENEQGEGMLRISTFLFFLLAASAGCGVYAGANFFVRDLWLGERYLMDLSVVRSCVVNFYVLVLSLPISVVMGVTGLFERERNIAVISAMLNMLLSLGMVKYWGIFGVLAGTFAAYLVQMCYRIYVFYHVYLGKDMGGYVAEILQYLVLGAAELWLVHAISAPVYGSGGLFRFLLLCLVAAGLPLALNLLFFCRSERLHRIFSMVCHGNKSA